MDDALAAMVANYGRNTGKPLEASVAIAPKEACVSVRRTKQFALFQPSTADRLDVGIHPEAMAPRGRLEASGRFNAMVSHRVRVAGPADIDAELVGWLRAAYDQANGGRP